MKIFGISALIVATGVLTFLHHRSAHAQVAASSGKGGCIILDDFTERCPLPPTDPKPKVIPQPQPKPMPRGPGNAEEDDGRVYVYKQKSNDNVLSKSPALELSRDRLEAKGALKVMEKKK